MPESLPPQIRELFVYENHLSKLPDNLPETLTSINVSDNEFTEIPVNLPPRLIDFSLENDQIERIPGNLLDNIGELNLAENNLSTLPSHLPDNLRHLDLQYNQLHTLPTSIWRLSSDMEIFVEGNPLSERSIRRLVDIDQLADYTGPQIFFSMSEDGSDVAPRPLTESVRDWVSTVIRQHMGGH